MSSSTQRAPEPEQAEELFIRFANTLQFSRSEPVEQIPNPEALLDWLRDAGLLSGRARAAEAGRLRRDAAEAERRLQRFRRLRDVLRDAASELIERGVPSPGHVGEVNHILRHGLHYHQLRREAGGTRYAVTQVGDRLDQARATIAASFAQFLASDDTGRLRICANAGCRYLFVDRSPAGRRRWCDMRTCGNQAKVARHRARARTGSGTAPSGATFDPEAGARTEPIS